MNQQELSEAGEILMNEIETWEKPEPGNVIATLAPADDQDADFVVTIIYYPKSLDGSKIASRPMFSLGEDDWNDDIKQTMREYFQQALDAISRQWETETERRAQEKA